MHRTKPAAVLAVLALLAACGREPTAARSPSQPRHDVLGATISGPSQVQLNHTCTWTAVVTGGTPPYRYFWSAWYQQAGRNSTFTSPVYEIGNKTLYLTVFDANDDEFTVIKGVSGTNALVGCPSS